MLYLAKRSKEILKKSGLVFLMQKFLLYPANIIYAFYYSFKIEEIYFGDNFDKLLDFVFTGCHGLLRPFQFRNEILKLVKMVFALKPKVLLEIGTATGGTLFLFSKVASTQCSIISIDLAQGRFGGGYPVWRIPLYRSFASAEQKIHLIRTSSHRNTALKRVKEIIGERLIDFLYIDGDHSYEGVKKDFQMYSPFVKKGGLIAFHDITVIPSEPGCEVHKFWEEIKPSYGHSEIINDKKQAGGGIGILFT